MFYVRYCLQINKPHICFTKLLANYPSIMRRVTYPPLHQSVDSPKVCAPFFRPRDGSKIRPVVIETDLRSVLPQARRICDPSCHWSVSIKRPPTKGGLNLFKVFYASFALAASTRLLKPSGSEIAISESILRLMSMSASLSPYINLL